MNPTGTSRAHRAALLALLSSCAVAQTSPAKSPPSPGSAPVAKAISAPALEKFEMRAQLTTRRYTTLAAEIGARISRIAFREGESFKAGQVLVSLDCSLQAANRDRARATLAAAENTHAGNQLLAEHKAIGNVELRTSAIEVDKARAELAFNNATLAKCNIPAPYNGRVAEQKAREGQYLQPGQAVLEVIDDGPLELEFIVPSRWLAWLKPDHKFQVAIDDTRKSYPARIQRIGARVDPVIQSVKVSAVIDGSFKELVAGMSGKVELAPPTGM
ncbi:MAG: efflux RND transporter periplasmic adaptor subunit [Ignavibacteria bacterium]